jgi:hypothetical protein
VRHGDGGTFLPWPKTLPGSGPDRHGRGAVRAAGGVAELRCTPVFM